MHVSRFLIILIGMSVASACFGQNSTDTTSAKEIKALVFKFINLMENKDFDRFGEIITEDYIQHNSMINQGLSGIKDGASSFMSIFPDLSASVEEIAVDGDLVVARIHWTGTHSSEFLGIPASGVKASWTGTDWWRVKNGKFVEHWDVVDWSALINKISKKN